MAMLSLSCCSRKGGGRGAVRVQCQVCRLSLFLASITACLSPAMRAKALPLVGV